jgi:tetratricopeptide (TPR) repeat protein
VTGRRDQERGAWQLQRAAVEALPPRTPLDEARPMLEALLALAGAMGDRLRLVGEQAHRLGQFALAERACDRLDDDASIEDLLDAAYCRYLRGDSAGALDRLARLDEAALDHVDRAWLLLQRACYQLDRGDGLDGVERDLAAAAPFCSEHNGLRGLLAMGRGRLALARGDHRAAVAGLRDAVDSHAYGHPFVLVALGDALAAAGDVGAASDVWSRAHDLAHPESFHAGEARRRMMAPFR